VAEENFRSTQKQLKATLAQLKDLEGRLSMNETQTTSHDAEVQTLRDQLRETAERLHRAELDNNQMRERMALRQQELEAARDALAAAKVEDADAIRQALDGAENRVIELTRHLEKVEAELDYTQSKFHMTKLSEALREFDNDELQIQEDDDRYPHGVTIRNRSGATTTSRK
jgi:chromosome segregation ATPase